MAGMRSLRLQHAPTFPAASSAELRIVALLRRTAHMQGAETPSLASIRGSADRWGLLRTSFDMQEAESLGIFYHMTTVVIDSVAGLRMKLRWLPWRL